MAILSPFLIVEMAWTTYLVRMYGSFSLPLPIIRNPWSGCSIEDSIILLYFDCWLYEKEAFCS